VTASSRGIGKGIAKVLSSAGANVLLVSRNLDRLKAAADEIREVSGNTVDYIRADLTKNRDLMMLVEEVRKRYDTIDIFIFNTGGPRPGYFSELDMSDWDLAYKLLMYSAVFLTREFIDDMKRNKWGRIVYSTSIAIKEPVPGLILSNSIRIGIAGLVRTLAKEYGEYGITVNAIMPGYIETERITEIATKRAEEEGKRIEDIIREMSVKIPMKRMGRPEELGYLACFLASDYASYINGAIIPVDGGLLNSSL
jgi:3-oxoacyl-[acyl-carrier protein] reductase